MWTCVALAGLDLTVAKGWPQTHGYTCLCLLNAGTKGPCHYVQWTCVFFGMYLKVWFLGPHLTSRGNGTLTSIFQSNYCFTSSQHCIFTYTWFVPLWMSSDMHCVWSCACWSLLFLWKTIYSNSLSMFKIRKKDFLLLNCKCSLYILDTSSLLNKWFPIFFSLRFLCFQSYFSDPVCCTAIKISLNRVLLLYLNLDCYSGFLLPTERKELKTVSKYTGSKTLYMSLVSSLVCCCWFPTFSFPATLPFPGQNHFL